MKKSDFPFIKVIQEEQVFKFFSFFMFSMDMRGMR